MEPLHFVNASTEGHFKAMSLIHALGWRTTYPGYVPADYMAREITDDHWVPTFRKDYVSESCHGLLLYSGSAPVACCSYGPARVSKYKNWCEVISFYTHPGHRDAGYGGVLMEETLRRLKADGFSHCYVLVLRENAGARRFYAAHGFSWDGTYEDIHFPPDAISVDLRYVREL